MNMILVSLSLCTPSLFLYQHPNSNQPQHTLDFEGLLRERSERWVVVGRGFRKSVDMKSHNKSVDTYNLSGISSRPVRPGVVPSLNPLTNKGDDQPSPLTLETQNNILLLHI